MSRTGLGLRLSGSLPSFVALGATVTVEAQLPFDIGHFYASAEVVRVGVQNEVGLHFVEDMPSSLGALFSFLQQRPVRALFVACGSYEDIAARALPSSQVFATFVQTLDEARAFVELEEIAALVLGEVPPLDAASALTELYAGDDPLNATALVLAAGTDLEPFADEVSRGHVFYLTHRLPVADAIVPLVQGSVERYWTRVRAKEVSRGARAQSMDDEMFARVLQYSDTASRAFGPASLRDAAEEGVRELTGARRAYLLYHHEEEEVLWSPASGKAEQREISSAAGLVSFTARTGLGTMLARLHDDARYERDADAPEGTGAERGMTEAVLGVGRHSLAVLVAQRESSDKPFSPDEQASLRLFAAQLSGPIARLGETLETERRAQNAGSIFNPRALEALKEGDRAPGQVLALHSALLDNALRLIVAFAAVALLFTVFVKIRTYGDGHALVRLERKVPVTARAPGVITRVFVQRGETVHTGDILCSLDDKKEAADLARVTSDFEQQMIRWLRDPADTVAAKQVAEARAQRDLAEANLKLRFVTADVAGVVSDLRVFPGQHVTAGDMLATLAPEGAVRYSLVAFFPGMYRPRAGVGSHVRLELNGYRFAYVDVAVQSVSDEVIGPTEARRILGREQSDSIPINGPVFLATAQMEGEGFVLDDQTYRYYDGLIAAAQIELREEPIIMTILPWLRRLTHRWSSGH